VLVNNRSEGSAPPQSTDVRQIDGIPSHRRQQVGNLRVGRSPLYRGVMRRSTVNSAEKLSIPSGAGDVPLRGRQTCSLTVTVPFEEGLLVPGVTVRWVRGPEYGMESVVAEKQTQSRLEQ